MKIFEKCDIDFTFNENMFSNFVINSIDERRCFDIFVNEMIDIDYEFIFCELFSNFIKEIRNIFIEFRKIRHFDIFIFFENRQIVLRACLTNRFDK